MSKVFLNDKKTMNIENREKKQVIISYKSYAVQIVNSKYKYKCKCNIVYDIYFNCKNFALCML